MQWQDIVLSIGTVVFVVALIPSVFGSAKPAFSTCAMTGVVAGVFALVYTTLSLWFAAALTAVNSAMWLTMAVQQHVRNQKLKKTS